MLPGRSTGSLRGVEGDLGAHGVEPVGKGFALVVGQARAGVDDFVRGDGHAAVSDLIRALFEFLSGTFGGKLVEVGEVEVFLAFADVAGKPPADGLHLGVPGIVGMVGMAVVAGGFEEVAELGGDWMPDLDIEGAGGGPEVFRLAYELDC